MLFYSDKWQLIIILAQVVCYMNAYTMNLLIFKPQNFIASLFITLLFIRSVMSFYLANKSHKKCHNQKRQTAGEDQKQQLKSDNTQSQTYKQQNGTRIKRQIKTQNSLRYQTQSPVAQKSPQNTLNSLQYCKHCKVYIQNRDHHCVYIGRCVQKQNYQYFLSYVIFSYILSILGLMRIYFNFEFVYLCWQLDQSLYIGHFAFSIISHIFFAIFTGLLAAGSIRSIIQGVYLVDQIKKRKEFKRSNYQFFLMCFTIKGLRQLYKDFKQNWNKMVGQNVSIFNIFFSFQ